MDAEREKQEQARFEHDTCNTRLESERNDLLSAVKAKKLREAKDFREGAEEGRR